MKNITERIYEGYGRYGYYPNRSSQPDDVELHFKGLIPAYLYDSEFAGQISDGKYENARPYDHWKWIINAKIIVDGNEYYTSSRNKISKRYSFSDFAKYIENALNGDKNYLWTLRILNYGRLAKVLENMGETEIVENEYFDNIAEIFGSALYKDPNIEFDDVKSTIPEYRKKVTSSKYYNKKYFEAFKKTEYTLKEVKSDIKSMCKTINTFNSEV